MNRPTRHAIAASPALPSAATTLLANGTTCPGNCSICFVSTRIGSVDQPVMPG